MAVQVCNMHGEWVLGVVIKHKKKCKEAVNLSDHRSPHVRDSHLFDALVSLVALTWLFWFWSQNHTFYGNVQDCKHTTERN